MTLVLGCFNWHFTRRGNAAGNEHERELHLFRTRLNKISSCAFELSDPVVTTLDDVKTFQGSQVELPVEYEATSNVTITWKRNGEAISKLNDSPRTGSTSIVIANLQRQHNGNQYTVNITDNGRRQAQTSARVFLY